MSQPKSVIAEIISRELLKQVYLFRNMESRLGFNHTHTSTTNNNFKVMPNALDDKKDDSRSSESLIPLI